VFACAISQDKRRGAVGLVPRNFLGGAILEQYCTSGADRVNLFPIAVLHDMPHVDAQRDNDGWCNLPCLAVVVWDSAKGTKVSVVFLIVRVRRIIRRATKINSYAGCIWLRGGCAV